MLPVTACDRDIELNSPRAGRNKLRPIAHPAPFGPRHTRQDTPIHPSIAIGENAAAAIADRERVG